MVSNFRYILLTLLIPLLVFAADIIYGKVVGITDGDTIKIFDGKRQLKIRLYGIDCPEKKQPFGTRAKQFTAALVAGKRVRIVTHDKDRYGRIVGEVFLADGTCLNKELLKNGLAWWYRQYALNEKEYAALEAEARDKCIGLWKDKYCRPPWEWRKEKTALRRTSNE
jgi:micrococcal nuclease